MDHDGSSVPATSRNVNRSRSEEFWRGTTQDLAVTSRGDRKRDLCSRDGPPHFTVRLQRRATSKKIHHRPRRPDNSSVSQPLDRVLANDS